MYPQASHFTFDSHVLNIRGLHIADHFNKSHITLINHLQSFPEIYQHS